MITKQNLIEGYYMVENNHCDHAISVGYPPLQDAAQFYWSRAEAIRKPIGYFERRTGIVKVDEKRVCDINTEEDWKKAERMYAALKEGRS
jgi:CMP-N-acetylneuraminic acid synthetase